MVNSLASAENIRFEFYFNAYPNELLFITID